MTLSLRDYQLDCLQRSLAAYQSGINRQLAVLATGLGKCLGKGTPVLMFDGTIRPVETIAVDELLMGPDSQPRRVKSLARGREEMFRVIPIKGDAYVVNRSHILSLKMTPRGTKYPSYLGKRIDISVDEYLKKGSTFRHMAKGWRAPVDFPPSREPMFLEPYFLGVWLGDGSSAGPNVTSADSEIIDYLYSLAERHSLQVRVDQQKDNKAATYHLHGKRGKPDQNPLLNALRYHRLTGDKHIPMCYKRGTREQRLEILAGIIDTDGYHADRGFQLTLKNEELMDDVIFVARSLGFSAYKSPVKKRSQNGTEGTYYHCNINGPVDTIPCRIPRKKAQPRRQKKDHLVTGIRLESIGEGEYFGFEIEGPDRLFLLGDFTVTHNTAISANLMAHHGFRGKLLFAIHMETLAVQAANAMQKWNPNARVAVEMANSYADMDGFYPPDIIVASIPTLGRKGSDRIKRFNPADFSAVIQDECHIGISDSFKRVYQHFGLLEPNPEGPLFLGITATPNRTDGKGLKELFDMIVFDMGIVDGIEKGWLCDLRGYRVDGHAKLDKVHTRAGDFAQDELSDEVNTPERNAIIVKEWYKVAFGKRTLAFTVDVQHALDLAEAFRVHGIGAKAVWGDDPDRHQKILEHKTGKIDVLCNCAVLSIGYDDPHIQCIISAAPTKSHLRYTQQIGRGTRIADGKQECIVIDVVDNSKKHSLSTISSLLGLPKTLDLKGEKFSVAKEKLERVAREFPTANIQDITSLNNLKSVAENAALFHPNYPPEIARMSEFAWRKSADGYIITVNRELVTVKQDLRGDWMVRGKIGDRIAEFSAQNLPGALNLADRWIQDSGGVGTLLKREARWHDDPPTPAQLWKCRQLKIEVPPNATKGQISRAIDAKQMQGVRG